jgi:hypothetical protein
MMAAKVMAAKFSGLCKSCGVWFPAATSILWAAGHGAVHATPAACEAAKVAKVALALVPAAPAAPAPSLDAAPMAAFLMAAAGKLKFPSVRFLAPGGGELKLYVAGPRSKAPGSIQVLVNDNWLGRLTPAGEVHGGKLANDTALLATLAAIAADPAKAAKEYGALRGACSFCAKGLTDEGSLEMGYGRTCSKNYNLPWKRGGTKKLTEEVPESALPVAA